MWYTVAVKLMALGVGMLERVAAAIASRTHSRPWDKMCPDLQAGYLLDAEYALREARVPTEAMLKAASREAVESGFPGNEVYWKELYCSMIDAGRAPLRLSFTNREVDDAHHR